MPWRTPPRPLQVQECDHNKVDHMVPLSGNPQRSILTCLLITGGIHCYQCAPPVGSLEDRTVPAKAYATGPFDQSSVKSQLVLKCYEAWKSVVCDLRARQSWILW